MGDSHHFHHHHGHTRPKSQVFCDDEDDDLDFPERSSSSTGLLRHSETHHSVTERQSQNQKSELEQLRSRVSQMDCQIKWWSECTSNWKQKWSQVRQERNALRAQLKEITGGSVAPKPEMKQIAVQTDPVEDHHQMSNHNAQNISTAADVHLLTKLLDEAQRTISIEREEKLHLHRSIERLQQDLLEFHTMYDELVKEVQLLKLDDNNRKVSEELELEPNDDEEQPPEPPIRKDSNPKPREEHQQSQNQKVAQAQEVEEVETAVDGDDEEDDDDVVEEICNDNAKNSLEKEAIKELQGSGNRIMMMSNSKSQQIASKPAITNDADHHTSL